MYKLKHWLIEVWWRQKLPRFIKSAYSQLISPAGILVLVIFIVAVFSGLKLSDVFKSEMDQLKEEVSFSVEKPYKMPDFRVEEWLDDENKARPDSPVQVIVFWNASCLSCQRVLPRVQEWSDKYEKDGLSVLGVHAPEFSFEKSPDTIQKSAKRLGVSFPVAVDNEFKISDAFDNDSAPSLIFVDQHKKVRHIEVGEGNYSHSERVIQALLAEHDEKLSYEKPQSSLADEPQLNFLQTSDIYVGYALTDAFANIDDLVKDETATYRYRSAGLNQFSLEGNWLVEPVSIKSADDAKLNIHFAAKDVYIVMGAASSSRLQTDFGKELLPGRDYAGDGIVVDEHRIYHLATAENFLGDAVLTLKVSPGIEIYKIYFGG